MPRKEDLASYYRTDNKAPSPFASALGGSGATAAPAAPRFAPAASSGMPSSRNDGVRPYSALTDPNGPLARAGWIGALMTGMAGGQTQEQYLLAKQEANQQKVGNIRARAFKSISDMMMNGVPAERAVLQYISTPEGMEYVATEPDMTSAMKEFKEVVVPSVQQQQLAQRQRIMAGVPAQGEPQSSAPPANGSQQPGSALMQPTSIVHDAQLVPGTGGPAQQAPSGGFANTTPLEEGDDPVANELGIPQGWDSHSLLKKSQELMTAGDDEGARLALSLAQEYRQLAKPEGSDMTDELKEYRAYRKQELQAGRAPMSWYDYKVNITREARPQTNINTAEGLQQAQSKFRFELDKEAAKSANDASTQIQKALPVLDEIDRISDKIPGGYAGPMAKLAARFASTFGMEVKPEWSDAETFDALTMQLFPIVRQPGQVSNYEQATYREALPNLMQSQQGRRKVTNTLRKMAQRSLEITAVYRKYGGSDELPDRLAEIQSKPLFSKEEIAAFEKEAQPPQGVTKEEWGAMTPDERKLFKQ